MENQIYYIRIKKEYAAALIKDLHQADAIEIMEELVPEQQQKGPTKRLDNTTADSPSTLNKDEFLKALDEEE